MSDVALPIGADPQIVDEWQIDSTGEDPTYRCFWSTSFHESPNIRVVGVQLTDGSVCLEPGDAPAVYVAHEPMPPAAARAMADALNAAADLADKWAGSR